MTADQFVKIISWALPLAAIAGAMYVYLRQSADKATIDTLEKRVQGAQEGLLHDQDKQAANERAEASLKIKKLEDKVHELEQQNVTLARQVGVLQGVVTQEAAVAHLQSTLDTHHSETLNILQQIRGAKPA